MRKARVLTIAAAAMALIAAPAGAGSPQSEQSTTKGFRKAVTIDGIREHLVAFQSHADGPGGGSRVAGGPGFEASASYVRARAQAAGYTVSDHFFEFLFNADRTPPTFKQESPDGTTYVDGVDFSSMTFSGSTHVTAPVWAIDLVLPQAPTPGGTTSGCQATDFTGMPAGSIALVQRGTCTFGEKEANAQAAGAVATIIFNDGGDANRVAAINGTLGGPGHGPALGTSLAIGQDLANGVANGATGSTATVRIDRIEELRTTRNVIAESATGDANRVVVVGAHLDSVPRGGGIQDNGTGSATILEIAETLAAQERAPRNKLRFVWWGAEEFGLLGSRAYVASLSEAERDRIALNLNFDMLGSPNYVRFIYDGDNSSFPVGPDAQAGPAGSGEIERVFRDYFAAEGLAAAPTPFNARSDYGPFIAAGVGIPAGGLFTGAEGVKTAAQAGVYGGTAGQPFDQCYHLACDTIANVNLTGLDQMSDAAAHAVLHFAKRDLVANPLDDPAVVATPVGAGGGGGLHDDHDHEPADR